jgi:hypothetical protein
MHIFDDIKSSLNGTLEIALGIEKVNTMINPKKAHTEGKNLVNAVYKEIQYISNLSRNRLRNPVKIEQKETSKPAQTTKATSAPQVKTADLKKNLNFSIKNFNYQVRLSRAGKRVIGQVLKEENSSFSNSFDKTLSSRGGTPRPTVLPFVSFRTGRIESSTKLPQFQEYLENKGSNYMKMKYNDEILVRLDKASAKISKFKEDFDVKASNLIKNLEDRNKRASVLRTPAQTFDLKTSSLKNSKRSSVFIQSSPGKTVRSPARYSRQALSKTQPIFTDSVQGFNQARLKENQKLMDILSKIDLERPLILKQKVALIQNDHEKFRNRMHSLKKFENFRQSVESSRRSRQIQSKKQGVAYMNIIETFRIKRYKPSLGEIEVLDFWKQMVDLGWVITKNDLSEIEFQLMSKTLSNDNTAALLTKLQKAV